MALRPMRTQALGRWIVCLIATAVMAGCGATDLAPALGSVRVNGKLACGGRVVFLPVGGGQPALGEIDPRGRFTLSSGGRQQGAKIAKHHVVLKDVRCSVSDEGESYRATEATEFEVRQGTENVIDLNVLVGKGWLAIADD
jgi:hypothetical protein